MRKKNSKIKLNKQTQKKIPEEKKESTPVNLSTGIIDLTFKINFSDEDLIIKDDNEEEKKSISYYDIDNFKTISDSLG